MRRDVSFSERKAKMHGTSSSKQSTGLLVANPNATPRLALEGLADLANGKLRKLGVKKSSETEEARTWLRNHLIPLVAPESLTEGIRDAKLRDLLSSMMPDAEEIFANIAADLGNSAVKPQWSIVKA